MEIKSLERAMDFELSESYASGHLDLHEHSPTIYSMIEAYRAAKAFLKKGNDVGYGLIVFNESDVIALEKALNV